MMDKKLNILFLSDDDLIKSVVYDIHVMAEGLSAVGHNVFVVDCKRARPRIFGFSEEILSRVYPNSTVRLFRYSMWTFPIFAQSAIGFLSRFLFAFKKCRSISKRIVRQYDIDVIVAYSVVNSGATALSLSKAHRIPIVFRNIDMLYRLNSSKLIRTFVAVCELILYSRVDKLLALTPKYADYLNILGGDRSKIEPLLFPVSVPEKKFQPQDDFCDRVFEVLNDWSKGGSKIITFVGHFYKFSGLPDFLREFPRILKVVPVAKLVLVGDGPLRVELESLSKQLGIQGSVLFTGLRPFNQMPHFIGVSEICLNVYPIDGDMKDLFAAKVIQYLACGKAVVSSALPGMVDMFDGEASGIIFVRTIEEMRETIISLLINDDKREKLGRAGLSHVLENYERDKVIKRLEGILRSVCVEGNLKKNRESSRTLLSRLVVSRGIENRLYNSANNGYMFPIAGQRVNWIFKGTRLSRVDFMLDRIGEPSGLLQCVVRRVSDNALIGTLGVMDTGSLPWSLDGEPTWVSFSGKEIILPTTGHYRILIEWSSENPNERNHIRVRFNDQNTVTGCFTNYSERSGWRDYKKADASIIFSLY